VRKNANFLRLVEASSLASDNEFAKDLIIFHGELHEIADGRWLPVQPRGAWESSWAA
jgi:hypothetical protein